ncbi:MAG: inositol monophosphatase family protein [Actinomycetota bacterium]
MSSVLDLDNLLALARRAAADGAEIVRTGVPGAGAKPAVETKGAGDYVTAVDRASERVITETLRAGEPSIPVVGEEEGGESASRFWSVDPLDGTTNFLHRFPIVGVSVALVEEGRPVVGVVESPFLAETYWAARGSGAWVRRPGADTAPLRISDREPRQAVVATGFPFRRKERLPRYLAAFERCFERFEDLRRPGAASLDLAWVAAGVFDGFFELGLAPWDVAAGGLLIEEAGGVVSDWDGGPDYLSGHILAGSPAVHAELVAIASATG